MTALTVVLIVLAVLGGLAVLGTGAFLVLMAYAEGFKH